MEVLRGVADSHPMEIDSALFFRLHVGSVMASARLSLFRGCAPVVERSFDEDDELTTVIAAAIADAAEVAPTELPPLFESIDTDALAELFSRETGADLVVGFRVDGWNVFVGGDGQVRVCDATECVEPEPIFDDRGSAAGS